MEVKNFLILDISAELAASKNKTYRESVYKSYQALVGFLQQNDLTTKHLLDDGTVPPDDFRIMRADLTDEGYRVVTNGLEKWMDAIAAEKLSPTDVSVLQKELDKIKKS